MPPSKNLDEHLDRSDSWIDKQQVFDRQDARSIHHRDKLDERAATVRMRVEGLHHELVEMVAEYKLLQEGDDAHETERWSEYEALCADADAVAAPHPACPRSVALHYDSSLPLRDGATGKLKYKLHRQRSDRAPDWLNTLAAVVGTAVTAWSELVHECSTPDLDAPWRPAVDAVKGVGNAVRTEWRGQYNLCAHSDGTVESASKNVVGGSVGFSYADKYGDAWRMHLAHNSAHEDALAPLTGPRVNGRLSFEDTEPAFLPCEYLDQHREAMLDGIAFAELSGVQVAEQVCDHGAEYEHAIRMRWIRERPNKPLAPARLKEMVTLRAKRELAKAWDAPVTPPSSVYESTDEDIGAPMEETVEVTAGGGAPGDPDSSVSELADDFYDMNPPQFEKPWYAR